MSERKDSIVVAASGKVKGYHENGLHFFKGIPFAAPPVGDLRWMPPQPVKPWAGIRDAKTFGPVSYQNERLVENQFAGSHFEYSPQQYDEDCLYLNIFTPSPDNSKRPVMVWIHGGAFIIGAGSWPMWDGRHLCTRGEVVVVSINYRLGALGFMNLNEITKGQIPATGNEGLLDQVSALQWVKENILSFGGDPENVTVFGVSAGAMSIGCLLSMPGVQGLFKRAIAQSGAGHSVQPIENALQVSEHFLNILDIKPKDIKSLMDMPPDRIVSATNKLARTLDRVLLSPVCPVIDGIVLPEHPYKTCVQNKSARIPFLLGTNLNEFNAFWLMFPILTETEDKILKEYYGTRFQNDEIIKIISSYKKLHPKKYKTHNFSDVVSAVETDRNFRIPALRLAEARHANDNDAFVYLFTWPARVKRVVT